MTAKARLLLVEDTPSILQLYHEVLARLDVVLIDAETGAGALTVLREAVPDGGHEHALPERPGCTQSGRFVRLVLKEWLPGPDSNRRPFD